jgi:hypothetical protein
MISALITVPAITSMLSVPDNVPLEGIEYVPLTSNEFAFAVPKLNAMAHTAQASALLDFDLIIATPLGGTPHPYKHPARVYLIPTTSI